MDLGLKNKTVFITGGNSGIGEAVSKLYAAEEGVNIAFSYHINSQKANDLVKFIENQGNSAMAVRVDIDDFSTMEAAIIEIKQRYGNIHVLVNNAVKWAKPEYRGIAFENLPKEAWDEIFTVNFLGLAKLTQLIVPLMKTQNFGRIINISSDIALDGMPGSTAYGALKSALFGLTANLVSELSQHNILINDVIPSLTLTENARHFFDMEFQQQAKKAFPTGRVTTPEEIASLIAYLGSPANGHVNGEHIRVTGKGSQAMLNFIFQQTLTK